MEDKEWNEVSEVSVWSEKHATQLSTAPKSCGGART